MPFCCQTIVCGIATFPANARGRVVWAGLIEITKTTSMEMLSTVVIDKIKHYWIYD